MCKQDWTYVDGYEEISVGDWLVAVEGTDGKPTEKHVANVWNANGQKHCTIGAYFGFDCGRVLAYTTLPELPIGL